jgi:hypothetical protein
MKNIFLTENTENAEILVFEFLRMKKRLEIHQKRIRNV